MSNFFFTLHELISLIVELIFECVFVDLEEAIFYYTIPERMIGTPNTMRNQLLYLSFPPM